MKRLFVPAAFVVALVALLALVGCSGGAPSNPEVSDISTSPKVSITDSGFSPTEVSIKAGDTVTWTNDGKIPHTVAGEGFDSGAINPGKSFSRVFETPGTYDYYCRYHPSETGKVTVR